MESLFKDLQLRGKQVLAMITDGAAINGATVRNLEAFMPQMIRWTRGVVFHDKDPFFGRTQHPLAGRNVSFRTRTIKDICTDQDVCMMFKQSEKL